MINENQKAVSKAYKENYDLIDWSISSAPAPIVIELASSKIIKYEDNTGRELTRQHGIPCIRSDNPHVSQNAAVHADQVDSFNKQCVRGVHYEKGTGNLISTSSAAREREARRRGKSFG